MNGKGYTPICSSSCLSKTAILGFHGTTALIFKKAGSVFMI